MSSQCELTKPAVALRGTRLPASIIVHLKIKKKYNTAESSTIILALPNWCREFSWLTYLYFPISYDLRAAEPALFKAAVLMISLLRLFMMYVTATLAMAPHRVETV
jgi:hypothetical protein